MQQVMLKVPGVESVVSRVGRGESPADPTGPNEPDVIATITPVENRPRGLTQAKITDRYAQAPRRISRNQPDHDAAHRGSRG